MSPSCVCRFVSGPHARGERMGLRIQGAGTPCVVPAPRIKAYRAKAAELWAAAERTGNPNEQRWLIVAAECWEFAAERLETQLQQQRQLPLAFD